jgi:hypothetical protein
MLIQTQGNGFNHPLASEITGKAHYEKAPRPFEADGHRRGGWGRL